MTRSFKSQPEESPIGGEKRAPDFGGGFSIQGKLDSLSRYSANETSINAVRVDFGKRFVAIIIDFFAAYVVAQALGMIPFLGSLINGSHTLVIVGLLLIRDWLFEGRGIGKNLMGLQVVDVSTGHPASLWQSVQRNATVLGPLVVINLVSSGINTLNLVIHAFPQLATLPIPNLSDATLQIMNGLASVYTCIAIPYESYLVYSRADGRRFGCQLSGTAIVEAPMDFSTPVPRQ